MKTILFLSLLLASLSGLTQSTEGVITYETRVNMHRMLPPGQEERKAMIPEYRTIKTQLVFNNDESLYTPIIDDEEEEDGDRGRRPFRPMQSEVYLKQSTGIMLTKQEEKKFHVLNSKNTWTRCANAGRPMVFATDLPACS